MTKPVEYPMNLIEMDYCLDTSNYDRFLLDNYKRYLLHNYTAAELAGNEETAKHVPGLKSSYYAIWEAYMKKDYAYFKGLPDLNTGQRSLSANNTDATVADLNTLIRSLSADRKSRYYGIYEIPSIREAYMKWDYAYPIKGLPDLNTRQRSLSANNTDATVTDLNTLIRSLSANNTDATAADPTDNTDPTAADPTDNTDPTAADPTDNTDPTAADPTDNTDPTAADPTDNTDPTAADLPAMGEKLFSAAYVLHAGKQLVFWKNSAGARLIKDDDNNGVLNVYQVGWNSHELFDIPGHRLVATLVPKFCTLHGQWKAFSAETSNVLFTMGRPHIIQRRTDLLVSLADGGVDLKIRGSWKNRSCRVYRGGLVIAEMQSPGADMPEEAKFMIKIYPGENYALVVSLFVMMEAKKGSPWTISAEQSSFLDHVKTGSQYLGPICFAVLNNCIA